MFRNNYTPSKGIKLRLSVYFVLIFSMFLLYTCDNVPTNSVVEEDPNQNQDITNPVPDTSSTDTTDNDGNNPDDDNSGDNPSDDEDPSDGDNQDDEPNTPPASKSDFVVFDGTNFSPTPSAFAEAGIEPVDVIYATRMFDGRNNHDLAGSTELPDKQTITKVAREAAQVNNLAVIDIEHWQLDTKRTSVSNVNANIDRYMSVLKWFQEAAPETQFGYYGNVPIRSYFDAIDSPSSGTYADWMSRNDRLTPLANQADVLYPSVYTFYKDRQLWVDYAVAMINEAKRLNPDKPIYVFLWPRYHPYDSSGGKIEGDFWKLQLETVRKHADGVIIWAGSRFNWNPNDAWWQATKEFMEELKLNS